MNVICKSYDALCELVQFEINGVHAEYEDFGDKYDTKPYEAEPYCCANMEFIPDKPTEDILNKYKITKEEYYEICDMLVSELSFGCCGWCS